MVSVSNWLVGLSGVAVIAAAWPADAITIVLHNTGGVTPGSAAYRGFVQAAAFWDSVLTNTATIKLNVGFQSLGPANARVLGFSRENRRLVSVKSYESKLLANAATPLDTVATQNLPTLDGNNGIDVVTPGFIDPVNHTGIDARSRVFDTDGSTNNQLLVINTANAKALGYSLTGVTDGAITFNSDFAFDFNPTDGIAPGQVNFLVVALHEIGHALGFVSGVDNYDFYAGPNGPGAPGFSMFFGDQNTYAWGTPLDLFRYSSNPEGFGGGGPQLDWSIRDAPTDGANFAQPYFSIDGGRTALFNNLLSRGQFNTNSFQASHWRSSTIAGQSYLGIMDPVGGANNYVTALDLAAFDAIGYNSNIDVLADPTYRMTTGQIYTAFAVPEPATWALLICGFGLTGQALRRRRAGA